MYLKEGEHYGNIVVGRQEGWLPTFGSLPLPKPDSIVHGIPVIKSVESLQKHLQMALMVELSTIPLYLYASYSTGATDQLGTADVIRGVSIQEMLHLTLAGNCLKAVGGKPTLYPRKGVLENWPAYPMDMAGHAGQLRLNLRKPELEQLITFLRVELPEADGPPSDDDGYDTLGQFYEAIITAIKQLLPEIPDLFDPLSVSYQFDNTEVYHGTDPTDTVVVIKDQPTADQALQIIIDQGEGSKGSEMDGKELAHFYKFISLFKPPFPATVNVVDNPRTPEYKEGKIRAVSTVFDASYCFFLLSIEYIWTLSKDVNAAERVAVRKNFGLMNKVLKPIAKFLVTQPTNTTDPPRYKGRQAGAAFNYYEFSTKQPLKETQDLADAATKLYGSSVPVSLQTAFAALKTYTEVDLGFRA